MLKVEIESKDNNYDYWSDLVVTHNEKEILREDDRMEPEDASFVRDLSWVSDIIEKAYLLGISDGINNFANNHEKKKG